MKYKTILDFCCGISRHSLFVFRQSENRNAPYPNNARRQMSDSLPNRLIPVPNVVNGDSCGYWHYRFPGRHDDALK